jgi:anti-anti-sigma factor
MFDLYLTIENGIKTLNISGRIDGNSAPAIEDEINKQLDESEKVMALNFELVKYMSSAGLRTLLVLQKKLLNAGGELVLYKVAPNIYKILSSSGFDKIFRIVDQPNEISSVFQGDQGTQPAIREINGINFSYKKRQASPGRIFPIGSLSKLRRSEFTESDVVRIKASEIGYGLGLAAAGSDFTDYSDYFGEAAVINRDLFYYPAVERPKTDYMLYSESDEDLEYNFLYGFGFNGMFEYVLNFENQRERSVSIEHLLESLLEFTGHDLFGIVILAESDGLMGMHLKKSPVLGNRPDNIDDIFSEKNISSWMDFPIEPTDRGSAVIACGVAAPEDAEMGELSEIFSRKNNYHIHGLIFDKALLNTDIDKFNKEINRTMTQTNIRKVQHLTGKSRFRKGIIGIINLSEK